MKYISAIIFVLMMYSYFSTKVALALKEDKDRLEYNQETLYSEAQTYKAADSLSAIKTRALQLELSEAKRLHAEELNRLKESKANISTLKQLITAQTKTISHLKLKLEDSIRVDTVLLLIDTIPCFKYQSSWTDIQGCLIKDSIDLQIKNKESLILAKSLRKKKFLFFKLPVWLFGYKQEELDIISENPNTTITEVKYIELVK